MTRARRSLLLPAMLAVLVAVFFAVLFLDRWHATRVRPPPAPVAAEAPPTAPAPPTPASPPPQPRATPSSLNRCVGGSAPVYTTEACPPGMRLEREIAVEVQPSEPSDLRRARERCEAGKLRRRVELAKLGARRVESDERLWADYAARECAEYTARAR